MKKFLVIFLFVFSANLLPAQAFVKLGYGAAFYQLDHLNDLLARYNTTRTWLDNEMKQMNYLYTPHWGGGFQFEHLRVEGAWNKDIRRLSASGIAPGSSEVSKRYVKVKNGRFCTSVSLHPDQKSLGFGVGFDAGYFRTYSRIDSEKKYTKYDRNLSSGATVFLSFFPIYRRSSLGLQLFYRYAFGTVSCDRLGYELDPVNYNKFVPADFEDKASSFGITLSYAFTLGDY